MVWGFSGQIWSDYNSYHAVLSIQIYTSANTVNTILLPSTPTSPTALAMVNKKQKQRKKGEQSQIVIIRTYFGQER